MGKGKGQKYKEPTTTTTTTTTSTTTDLATDGYGDVYGGNPYGGNNAGVNDNGNAGDYATTTVLVTLPDDPITTEFPTGMPTTIQSDNLKCWTCDGQDPQ